MPDAVSVEIKGLAKLNRMLNRLAKQDRVEAMKVIREAAADFQARVVPLTPWKTGALRGAWTARGAWREGRDYVDIHNAMEYAPYVEFGTRRRGGPTKVRRDIKGRFVAGFRGAHMAEKAIAGTYAAMKRRLR